MLRKTLLKTVLYKLIATIELALVALVISGSFELAGKVGMFHLGVSTLTYAGFDHIFELIWEKFV
jgi:uncharacterized membrane protein